MPSQTKHNPTQTAFHFPHTVPIRYTLTASLAKASANKRVFLYLTFVTILPSAYRLKIPSCRLCSHFVYIWYDKDCSDCSLFRFKDSIKKDSREQLGDIFIEIWSQIWPCGKNQKLKSCLWKASIVTRYFQRK